LGWLDVAARMRAGAAEIDDFADEIHAAGFDDIVLLGMGGSSLAPEVLRQAIAGPANKRHRHPRLHVLDTTDPETILRVARGVDLSRALFFVSSKSGTTIEANTLFDYFHDRVGSTTGSDAGSHFVAITDEGTPLSELARTRGFRSVFINPADIGGRYSALSYFGLIPAAVAGVDVRQLLDRAVEEAQRSSESASEALLLGAALGELALRGRDKCTIIASPSIASFGLWAEQLIAESTGKEGRGILPVDGEPLGTPRHYGGDRVFVYLRLEADSNGHTDATVGALVGEGFPAITIEFDDVYDLGREFFRWEFAVAVAGQVLGINPFDEPNVQESKDNTNRVLRDFEATGKLDAAALDDEMPVAVSPVDGASKVAPAVARLLAGLRPGDYLAVTAYLPQGREAGEMLGDVRALVRDATHCATTLGYGPRYLHSTGQLHKGGPLRGTFLQITAADTEDAEIPGRPFTFGQLKRAQAIGDFQALAAHGRPVLRVHLGRDMASGLQHLREAVLAATCTRV
jgi:glucose-6-phosphate isomerase